jgi:hypothetical protein
VDWEKQVEPHLLQLVQVAKDCKRVENVFSSLDWGASERSGVFKSRQQALGRCQTVLTIALQNIMLPLLLRPLQSSTHCLWLWRQ